MVPTVGNAGWHERLEEVEDVSDVLVQRVVPDRTGQSRGGRQEEAQQDQQSHPVLTNSYYRLIRSIKMLVITSNYLRAS